MPGGLPNRLMPEGRGSGNRFPNPSGLCRKGCPTSLCWKGRECDHRRSQTQPAYAGRVAQPAYAGRAGNATAASPKPNWLMLEGCMALLEIPGRLGQAVGCYQLTQPDQLMLEGHGLPGNYRKARSVGVHFFFEWGHISSCVDCFVCRNCNKVFLTRLKTMPVLFGPCISL